MAGRYRAGIVMALLCLGLLVGLLPGYAGQRASAAGLQVAGATGGVTITSVSSHMTVFVNDSPLGISVYGASSSALIGGHNDPARLTFTLNPTVIRRFVSGYRAGGHPVTVHMVHLLQRQVRADLVRLTVATDDPLSRRALIDIRFTARGTVEVLARLTDDRGVVATNLAVPSGLDEHFFGMGEQFGGVDQRGRRVGVLVQDGMTTIRPLGGYAPVPFFLSTRGYGYYLAGSSPSQFSLDAAPEPSTWQVQVQAPSMECFLFDGPLPTAALARYADLTGHPPMPPPWTVGVWKTAIGGQARVLAEAARLRAAHIPISVIWTYDAVDESVKLGWPYPNFARIPPGPYPNLPAFTAALHREGYQVLGYLAPEFTRSRPGFAYPAQRHYFVRSTSGHVYLIDLTNPAALAWWERAERTILTTLGFDGWLLDLGDRLPPGARFFNGSSAAQMANRYPLLLAQAAADVARQVKPTALYVMRSSFSGVQSLQPAVWPGDQRADWSTTQGLPAAISAGLSWGMSGAPFWGSDIGGYLAGKAPAAQREELWLRWLEFGAFSPIMRDQLGNMDYDAVYLWSNAHTEAAFRRYAQLHQSLFPYLYAAARTAHRTGLPIMRQLFLAYPHDTQVYGLNDEYLLGPDLLVAPVITPGVAGRSVYLPAGTWVDYWTGAQFSGGRRIWAPAPLDDIPLFVRGGAVIPTLSTPGDTLASSGEATVHRAGPDLTVRLYPGGDGERSILADGTLLAARRTRSGMTLEIDGPSRRYTLLLALTSVPRVVRLNGQSVHTWHYDARQHLLHLDLHLVQGYAMLMVTL